MPDAIAPPSSIFLAPVGSTLEQHFAQYVVEQLNTKRSPSKTIILVPSHRLGIYLRQGLAQLNSGHFGINTWTFLQLSRQISWQVPWSLEVEALALLERMATTQPSMSASVCRHLLNMIHHGIEHNLPAPSTDNSPSEWLVAAWHHHQEMMAGEFCCGAGCLAAAVTSLQQDLNQLDVAQVFVYGFYDFSPLQKSIIEVLSPLIQAYWVPQPRPDSILVEQTVAFLQTFTHTVKVLHHDHQQKRVAICSAPTPYREVIDIATSIKSLLAQGTEPADIAILYRQQQPYLNLCLDALQRGNIAFYMEGGRPLLLTPWGRATSALIGYLQSTRRCFDLLLLLEALPMHDQWVTGDVGDWHTWIKHSQALFVERDLMERLTQLLATADSRYQAMMPALASLVDFLPKLLEHIKAIEQACEWSTFALALQSLFCTFGKSDPFLPPWLETLHRLNCWQNLPADSNHHLWLLQECLATTTLETEPWQRGQIYLGPIASARAVMFGHVFLPGLNEGLFPARAAQTEDPTDRASSPSSTWSTHLAQEQDLFAVSTAMAQQALYISYARWRDSDDRQQHPSTLLARLVDPVVHITHRHLPLRSWQSSQPPMIYLDRHHWLEAGVTQAVVHHPGFNLADFAPLAGQVADWVAKHLSNKALTAFEGVIEASPSFMQTRFSPARITEFCRCPYAYFLRYELQVQVDKSSEDQLQLSALDRGVIIHHILFALLNQLKSSQALPLQANDRQQILAQMATLAATTFQNVAPSLPLAFPEIWAFEQQSILADITAFLQHEFDSPSHYQPHAFEVRFGMPAQSVDEDSVYSTDQALWLQGPLTRVALCGKMDRIDLDSSGQCAQIIDYKTGQLRQFADNALKGGRGLQLPIYLMALPLLFPHVDLSRSSASIRSTSMKDGLKSVEFLGSYLEQRRGDVEHIIFTLAQARSLGVFPPRPGDQNDNCRFCDFVAICGPSIGRCMARKQPHGIAQELLDLENIE